MGFRMWLVGGHATTHKIWAFFENAHFRHLSDGAPWREPQTATPYTQLTWQDPFCVLDSHGKIFVKAFLPVGCCFQVIACQSCLTKFQYSDVGTMARSMARRRHFKALAAAGRAAKAAARAAKVLQHRREQRIAERDLEVATFCENSEGLRNPSGRSLLRRTGLPF